MMEYPGAARQSRRGASSFGADERVEGSKPRGGPEDWPEWKQEDDQAYRQYLDEVFKGIWTDRLKRPGWAWAV
jgi:hypothetical protein